MAFFMARSARSNPDLRRLSAGVAGILVLLALPVRAQHDAATTMLVSVPRLASLVVQGDVSSLLTLTAGGPGESTFDAGRVESAESATLLRISTNGPWDLSARLGAPWTCPGTYDKSEQDLFLRVTDRTDGEIQNGADSFVNLSGLDLVLVSNGSASAAATIGLQSGVLLDWTKDVPGNYSITVAYTLVTPLP
jgi:hypothetical protein